LLLVVAVVAAAAAVVAAGLAACWKAVLPDHPCHTASPSAAAVAAAAAQVVLPAILAVAVVQAQLRVWCRCPAVAAAAPDFRLLPLVPPAVQAAVVVVSVSGVLAAQPLAAGKATMAAQEQVSHLREAVAVAVVQVVAAAVAFNTELVVVAAAGFHPSRAEHTPEVAAAAGVKDIMAEPLAVEAVARVALPAQARLEGTAQPIPVAAGAVAIFFWRARS